MLNKQINNLKNRELLRQKPSFSSIGRCFAAASLVVLTSLGHADELPDTMNWTAFGVGSTGYAQATAIADAFGKEYGTKIRISPSSSGIGRLQPVLTGRSEIGFLATEGFFASEGLYDFASRRWGPQDLRGIAGVPATFGLVSAADANVHSIEDVRGKRVAYVVGNPSLNIKCDALLAFGDLTRDDVEIVLFPSYGAAMQSLTEGRADVSCNATTPSHLYELAESPRGIRWVDFVPSNEEGWERLREVAPFAQPFQETIGAGLSEDQPAWVMAYRYPGLTVTADASEDRVYQIIKALDETFHVYKDATAIMSRWELAGAGVPPMDVPFHPGAVRYLEEKGIWTEEHQAWNEQRLARLNALRNAWTETLAESKGMDDDEFAELWSKNRQSVLAELN